MYWCFQTKSALKGFLCTSLQCFMQLFSTLTFWTPGLSCCRCKKICLHSPPTMFIVSNLGGLAEWSCQTMQKEQ